MSKRRQALAILLAFDDEDRRLERRIHQFGQPVRQERHVRRA
jgi:hypothetical protein